MRTVGELLLDRPCALWSVAPACPAATALALMADKHVDCLPVLDAGQFVGLVTTPDFTAAAGHIAAATVGEVMKRPAAVVCPADTVETCLAVMIDREVRHLPVVQNARLIAVLSLRRVTEEILAERNSAPGPSSLQGFDGEAAVTIPGASE